MVIEPAVHNLFLEYAGRADGFQGSVMDCFQAVCQAIQQAIKHNLDRDACLLVNAIIQDIRNTDQAIRQTHQAVSELET